MLANFLSSFYQASKFRAEPQPLVSNGGNTTRGLCTNCFTLLANILSHSLTTLTTWKPLRSEHGSLFHFKDNANCQIWRLRASAAGGCKICSEIDRLVRQIDSKNNSELCHIFVWDAIWKRYEVQIAVAEPSEFLSHVSKRPCHKTMEIFAQRPLPKVKAPDKPLQFAAQGTKLRLLANPDPRSLESLQKASAWWLECTTQHTRCRRPKARLPKRVLYVGRQNQQQRISLHITNDEEEPKPYVALSYSWGEVDRLVTHRRNNHTRTCASEPASLKIKKIRKERVEGQREAKRITLYRCDPDNIPLNAFLRTQREAIEVARALGFEFIWIDALCIVQNDTADWEEQAVLMTDIYHGASLTISSSETENGDQGFLDPLQSERVIVGNLEDSTLGSTELNVVVGEPQKTLDLAETFIASRGWVFQETLVSVATLHYTNEGIVWECAETTQRAHDQSETGGKWKNRWHDVMERSVSALSKAASVRRPDFFYYDIWYDIISSYTACNLWNVNDKFPAVAGVARNLAQEFGLPDDAYLAGLWKDDFRTGLLWRRHSRAKFLARHGENVAPSWSWASVTGLLDHRKVNIVCSDTKGPKVVCRCAVQTKSSQPYGELLIATLQVTGLVQEVTLATWSNPNVGNSTYQACGIEEGFLNNTNVLCTLDEPSMTTLPHQSYLCLRIGSFNVNGREGDAFLLLQKEESPSNIYHRIGYVEADAWYDVRAETLNSGLLQAPQLKTLYIV